MHVHVHVHPTIVSVQNQDNQLSLHSLDNILFCYAKQKYFSRLTPYIYMYKHVVMKKRYFGVTTGLLIHVHVSILIFAGIITGNSIKNKLKLK